MKRILLPAVLLLAASSARTETDPWAPLEALRSLPTIEATGRIEIDRSQRGAWETLPFKLWFAAPGKFRTEVRAGVLGTILSVSDGEQVWLREKENAEVVHRQPFSAYTSRRDAGSDPFTAFLLNRDPLSENWRIDGTPTATQFRLVPLQRRSDLDHLDVRLSANGRSLVALEVVRRRRPWVKIRFDAWRSPESIPDARFAFDPEGLLVNDVR